MTRKIQYLMIFTLFFCMAVPCVRGQENQIVNSEFDEGLAPWGIYNYQNTAEGFTVEVVKDADLSGRNAVEIDIFDAPAVTSIGIATSGMVLVPGETYLIGFTAKAEEDRGMKVLCQGNINNAKWPNYVNTFIELTTEPQEFVFEYTYSGADIIGDDDTESIALYLIIKWPYANPDGYNLNSKVWIDRVYFGAEPPLPVYPKAGDIYPENGNDDVFRHVVLEWIPGDNADTHNLYFGDVAEDVNTADTGSALMLSTGKADTSYDAGILEYEKTYYWRVDEVNGVTVEKGDLWSFTIEPYSIPIEAVTAGASTTDANDMGPENTINGIGLDPNDLHSTEPNTMWLSVEGDSEPWIRYDFDKAYKLDVMQVWNANSEIELIPTLSLGVKDVTIEISTDGEKWTALDGPYQFAQGEGVDTYAANTTIDLGGALAQSVKINIDNGWGTTGQYSLSEVRFLYIPTFAREPKPADQGSGGKDLDVELAWRPGREAAIHEIYLGTDANDLGLLGISETASYVAESLDYDQTYFWQIVEVNDAETPSAYAGDLWSFTTIPFGVIDTMESYEDVNGLQIWLTWQDGSQYGTDDPQNGSLVGADPEQENYAPETGIVHSGQQSLPIWFDNTGDYLYSEVIRIFDEPMDLTANGIKTLSLMFHGNAQNTGQLYVKIGDTEPIYYDGDPSDIRKAMWLAWNIDLTSLVGDLQEVSSLTVGVEGADAEGVIYIDSIGVYPKAGEVIMPVVPDNANLELYLPLDGDYLDASGNNRHGTGMGGPQFVDGAVGQAIELDGVNDYVVIEGYKGVNADYTDPANPVQRPFTIVNWVNTTSTSGDTEMVTWGVQGSGTRLTWRVHLGTLRTEHAAGNLRGNTYVNDGQWHHVALVVTEGANLRPDKTKMYVDGREDSTFSGGDVTYKLIAEYDVRIGMSGPQNGRYFPGSLDEVRIYDRALSLAEIAGLSGRTAPIYQEF